MSLTDEAPVEAKNANDTGDNADDKSLGKVPSGDVDSIDIGLASEGDLPNGRRDSYFVDEGLQLPIMIIGPDNEEIRPDDIVIPPDGGWGWMVVLAAFLSNMIVDGSTYSSGIVLTHLVNLNTTDRDHGKVKTADMSWIIGIVVGFSLLSGPFVSLLANKVGFRTTAVIGGLLASSAYIIAAVVFISTKSVNLIVLYVCYGGIVGIGFGVIYVPAVVAVGFYFHKRRALATGMAVCGSGVGTFVFPPLAALFVEKYGWKETVMAQGIVLLICAGIALMYLPINTPKEAAPAMNTESRRNSPATISQIDNTTPYILKVKFANRADNSVMDTMKSLGSLPTNADTTMSKGGIHEASNAVLNTGIKPDDSKRDAQMESNDSLKVVLPTRDMISAANIQVTASEAISDDEDPITVIRRVSSDESDDSGSNYEMNRTLSVASTNRRTLLIKSSAYTNDDAEAGKEIKTITLLLPDVEEGVTESRVYRVADKETLNSPFNQSSIFYTGSFSQIPDFVDTQVAWEATPVLTDEVGFGEAPSAQPKEKRRHRFKFDIRILQKMLDVSLLKSYTFMLMAISGALCTLGFFVPFIYLAALVSDIKKPNENESKYTSSQGALLISIIGATNCLGRLLVGAIADKLGHHLLFVYNAALTMGGLLTIVVPFLKDYTLFATYAGLYGFCIACYVSLRSIILVQLLGLAKLTNAFGLLLLFQGFSALMGSPIAGYLKDETKSYDVSFYFAGSMILLSAILCYPVNVVNRWEIKRKHSRDLERVTAINNLYDDARSTTTKLLKYKSKSETNNAKKHSSRSELDVASKDRTKSAAAAFSS